MEETEKLAKKGLSGIATFIGGNGFGERLALLVLVAVLFLNSATAVSAVTNLGNGIDDGCDTYCNSCENCTESLELATGGQTVCLKDDLMDSHRVFDENYTTIECIKIHSDNKTFDCQGHLIKGCPMAGTAIAIESDDNIVKNCRIENYAVWGITIFGGNRNNIVNNEIIGTAMIVAITIRGSKENWIVGNIVENDNNGIEIFSDAYSTNDGNILRRNKVRGSSEHSDVGIKLSFYGEDNIVEDNEINGWGHGIMASGGVNLTDNIVNNNSGGIIAEKEVNLAFNKACNNNGKDISWSGDDHRVFINNTCDSRLRPGDSFRSWEYGTLENCTYRCPKASSETTVQNKSAGAPIDESNSGYGWLALAMLAAIILIVISFIWQEFFQR